MRSVPIDSPHGKNIIVGLAENDGQALRCRDPIELHSLIPLGQSVTYRFVFGATGRLRDEYPHEDCFLMFVPYVTEMSASLERALTDMEIELSGVRQHGGGTVVITRNADVCSIHFTVTTHCVTFMASSRETRYALSRALWMEIGLEHRPHGRSALDRMYDAIEAAEY